MRIVDLKDMPGFDPSVKNGIDSVSKGKVFVGVTHIRDFHSFVPAGFEEPGIVTVCCWAHGAMNKVAPVGIWRCFACNEGAFEVKEDRIGLNP